jgi:hypothetical protein
MRRFWKWFVGSKTQSKSRPVLRARPALEALEERAVPTVSAISSNFNGTPIAAGSTVWFNSVVKVNGVGASPVTIHVDNATISSGSFNAAVPDLVLTLDPAATSASTTFSAGEWNTTVPASGLPGNTFLAGAVLPLPSGLPGGVKPVTWQANFTTDTPGVTIQWQWAAAAYTSFGADYATLGVKPVDSNSASQYKNSDHAGTPENFRSFVTGGATGGGGSNWTGSYSSTASVVPDQFVPPPPPPSLGSLAGVVTNTFGQRLSGAVVTLTNTDTNQTWTFTTGGDGTFSFGSLAAGHYTLTETTPPPGTTFSSATAGTDGGTVSGNQITGITLNPGDNTTGYAYIDTLPM